MDGKRPPVMSQPDPAVLNTPLLAEIEPINTAMLPPPAMVIPPEPEKVIPVPETWMVPTTSLEAWSAEMCPSAHWPVRVTVVAFRVLIVPENVLIESVPILL